jgi:hypothetical protein
MSKIDYNQYIGMEDDFDTASKRYVHNGRSRNSDNTSSQRIQKDLAVKGSRQLKQELGFGLGNVVDETAGEME